MDPDKVHILCSDYSNREITQIEYNRVCTAIVNLSPSFRTNREFMPEEDLEARMDAFNGVEIFPKKDSRFECTSICLPDIERVFRVSVWKGDIVSFHYKNEKYTLYMKNQNSDLSI